jgi:hypothetical protein
MFVLDDKGVVAAWPVAHPLAKIFVARSWALTLARRRHAS